MHALDDLPAANPKSALNVVNGQNPRLPKQLHRRLLPIFRDDARLVRMTLGPVKSGLHMVRNILFRLQPLDEQPLTKTVDRASRKKPSS